MAFQKIVTAGSDVYASFDDDEIKLIVPGSGAVTLTEESFVKLLAYFRGYEFLLAKQNLDSTYYGKKKDLGYFVEDAEGNLIIVDIVATKVNKYGDVVFNTLDTDTAAIAKKLSLNANELASVIYAAAKEGIKSEAVEYRGIKFVELLPAETSAQRNTVYLFNGEYYTLNADEDALLKITVVPKNKLPEKATTAVEGVLYSLNRVQEEPSFGITFKPGLYTYTASSNTFTLQDLTLKKVNALPEEGEAGILYQLTADQAVSESETRAKGTRWTYSAETKKYTQDTREIKNVQKLPLVEIAVANTYYLVDKTVTLFANNKFTTIGKVVSVSALPDVTELKVDDTYIYTLTKDDGNRAKGTSWVFDTEEKEFVAYVDPTEDTEETVEGGGSGM